MREVDDLLKRRPGLGTLATDAGALRAQLSRERGYSVPGASALTAAELRLLPMLSTHLSFPEIAEELFLSRYTIKSQAMSIYHKLGASSRNQAVARSRAARAAGGMTPQSVNPPQRLVRAGLLEAPRLAGHWVGPGVDVHPERPARQLLYVPQPFRADGGQ